MANHARTVAAALPYAGAYPSLMALQVKRGRYADARRAELGRIVAARATLAASRNAYELGGASFALGVGRQVLANLRAARRLMAAQVPA
ncbi:hypothetical protein [Novosphingobium sp.]|uniref:hypothetical protein n=1 Tax=Novosphingobium sp. TaxID=1874826 RepID=UPI002FDDA3E9